MSYISKIEWTDTSWNPVTGCTPIGSGCKNCYAERFAERWRGIKGHPYEQGFDLKLWPERLDLPLKWEEPRMIFVNSMSDLFHEDIPDDFVLKIFGVMRRASQHTFQVLTKRPARMLSFIQKYFNVDAFPGNIWMGVSIERQNCVWRTYSLQKIPAKVRFISFEPLLEQIDLQQEYLTGIHWVIVGGESGPNARPMRKEWVNGIKSKCDIFKIPFFFKQWGEFNSFGRRVGKKSAGRLLDGRTYNAMPGR